MSQNGVALNLKITVHCESSYHNFKLIKPFNRKKLDPIHPNYIGEEDPQ